ncbi:hypothetical protein OZ410_07415 [Robiginitalea sp. M366]|uniref:hypothetical protein n=1 Tax=Robiginitalea aestuariiviva TaxID=3036903 RepID=UPI00240E41E6|nr:hypothetical protein [Robiginitalea aestuariiviva]MDG1572140.1 hypothetical protein [Robiginitalea aestuariiviva]
MRTTEITEKPLKTEALLEILQQLDPPQRPTRTHLFWPSHSQLQRAGESLKDFRRYTELAFWAYFGFLSMLAVTFLVEPNGFSASLTLLGFISFMGLLLISFYNHSDFYHAVGRAQEGESPLIIFFLGMPLYFLVYLHLEKRMRDELTDLLREMGLSEPLQSAS